MKRYPWTWSLEECRGELFWFFSTRGKDLVFVPRVPPDTARRRLWVRFIETEMAWVVDMKKQLRKEVR